MIFTLLFAGPVIESNFRWESDLKMKQHSAKLLRNVGLLSPFAALVLAITGIGNMIALNITFGDLFGRSAWLGIKLLIFIALLVMGMVMSPRTARQRLALLEHLGQPNPPDDLDDKMDALDKKQTTFFLMNWVLVLLILILSISKP